MKKTPPAVSTQRAAPAINLPERIEQLSAKRQEVIRPILEHEEGRLYLSINPDLSKALKGPDQHDSPEFEPGVKFAWSVTPLVAAGVEYYGATGSITHFLPGNEQRHMIFPTIDLDVSPDWELNFEVGRGLTGSSEHWIFKSIVGYRFRH